MIFQLLGIALISYVCTFNHAFNSDYNHNSNNDIEYVRLEEPKRAVEQVNTPISGYYNLKDTVDFSLERGTFTVIDTTDNIEGYFYYNNWYYKFNYLYVQYGITSTGTINAWYNRFTFNYFDDLDTQDWVTVTLRASGNDTTGYSSLSNYPQELQELIIYFPNTFYLNVSVNTPFDSMFTHDNNAYITSYQGYYNFSLSFTPSEFFVIGSFMIDNVLYNGIYGTETGEMYGSYTQYDNVESIQTSRRLIGNGANIRNKNTFWQVYKMPISVKSYFQTMGVFTYIQPDVQPYTFGDFFFSIMDAPIYYLRSLFSFELFGVNLFIAFTSILTLVIVVLVIKKVV